MSITPDWRSATAAEELNGLGRAGFAQEFLRRNEHYQKDYRRMARRIAAGAAGMDSATAGLARRWGLSFRVRSEAFGKPRSRPMAARTCP
jgi:hypothetical protein